LACLRNSLLNPTPSHKLPSPSHPSPPLGHLLGKASALWPQGRMVEGGYSSGA
jgi:hypothetical protein